MTERVGPTHTTHTGNHERGLRASVGEVLEEFREFVNTRLQMAKTEFREMLSSLRVAVPLSLVALAFIGVAFLLFTGAAVAIVTLAFAGNPYALFLAFIIVGVIWAAFGGIAAFFAYNSFRTRGRFPKRTFEVLKADKAWIQAEVRSHP